MLSEEAGFRSGTSGYTWAIDPIDGTTSFLDGLPGWVVSLAITRKDRAEAGVIRDPCAGETFRRGAAAVRI